jgi:hypothetical protein
MGRAEHGSYCLLKNEADAPGREKGFQRPAIEETDDATFDGDADQRRDQKRERDRDRQRPAEILRRGVAEEFLHDEGGVGAEHHHFAVRHVDDAHHAERDGEADGRKKQDRSE